MILFCLEQIEQKQKYAIWKAAEIRKALKEGRKPEAGPPGGDNDEAHVNTTTASQVTILTRIGFLMTFAMLSLASLKLPLYIYYSSMIFFNIANTDDRS